MEREGISSVLHQACQAKVEMSGFKEQREVLAEALRALYRIRDAGTIIDMPYKWRREQYGKKDISVILPLSGVGVKSSFD